MIIAHRSLLWPLRLFGQKKL